MAHSKRGTRTRIIFVFMLAITAAVGWRGWNWLDGLDLRTVRITGNVHAASDELLELASVDTGEALLAVDPRIVRDRVQRHPWVKSANATRLPPDLLSIDVRERVPVVLVIDAQGLPATYLDGGGYALPLTPETRFDVPLLKGVELPPHPTRPIEDRVVVDLLLTLATIRPDEDVLISSFEMDTKGQISLRTEPIHGRGSILVRLGRRDFADRLSYLKAFWREAVLTRPEISYEWIDLRFDSKIVTRETSGT